MPFQISAMLNIRSDRGRTARKPSISHSKGLRSQTRNIILNLYNYLRVNGGLANLRETEKKDCWYCSYQCSYLWITLTTSFSWEKRLHLDVQDMAVESRDSVKPIAHRVTQGLEKQCVKDVILLLMGPGQWARESHCPWRKVARASLPERDERRRSRGSFEVCFPFVCAKDRGLHSFSEKMMAA